MNSAGCGIVSCRVSHRITKKRTGRHNTINVAKGFRSGEQENFSSLSQNTGHSDRLPTAPRSQVFLGHKRVLSRFPSEIVGMSLLLPVWNVSQKVASNDEDLQETLDCDAFRYHVDILHSPKWS